jgi:hypothetical protein
MPNSKLDEIYVRLYYGDPRDEAIANHLRQFDNSPKGTKHDEAKRLMHLGLQYLKRGDSHDADTIQRIAQEAAHQAVEASSSCLDQGTVREAVRSAMHEMHEVDNGGLDFTLSDIRRVVEVALDQRLDRLADPNVVEAEKIEEDENDDEINAALERLGKSLMH